MSWYPELDSQIKIKIKNELYLSFYATKADFLNHLQVLVHFSWKQKIDLAILKADVDKLEIAKLQFYWIK